MDFYEALDKKGLFHVLDEPFEELPTFIGDQAVLPALVSIIKENKRVLVYRDYDPDGAYAGDALKDTFNHLGFTNFTMARYTRRTHKVDPAVIKQAIMENYDCLIIFDAGSSDPEPLLRLVAMGVEVILIDHHQSVYGYEDFKGVKMLNTSFENRVRKDEVHVSAGALSYLTCRKLCNLLGVQEPEGLSALALASMYSDSIDMSSNLGRLIYKKATSLRMTKLPRLLQHMMTQTESSQYTHVHFTRRYLEFQVNPKLNALFRAERFDLLNKLLNWDSSRDSGLSDLVSKIEDVWKESSNEVGKISDLIEVAIRKNFVIGNLSSITQEDTRIPIENLSNYTGLIANRLGQKYNRTAVVYADAGSEVKGSLRDPYSRNYLDLFRTFCKAEGHNAAFGIKLSYIEITNFLSFINTIDRHYFIKSVTNLPLIVSHNFDESPDSRNPEDAKRYKYFSKMIRDIARYNEFSGIQIPTAFVSRIWLMKPTPTGKAGSYYNRYKWGEFTIKSRGLIEKDTEILLKPYKSIVTQNGWKPELMFMEVLGKV